ncbi:unnamed protein product [Victoria cruziana]
MEPSATADGDDAAAFKEKRLRLEESIENSRRDQDDLIASLQSIVPDLISSLDLSLRVVSAFKSFPPNPNPKKRPSSISSSHPPDRPGRRVLPSTDARQKASHGLPDVRPRPDRTADAGAKALPVVRSMIALLLLERVPFTSIDSAAILRKLENEQASAASPVERAALLELGGEAGPIAGVEAALRSLAESGGAVDLEEFFVSGKSRFMVLGIDRNRLVKELPENSQGGEGDGGGGGAAPASAVTLAPVPAVTEPNNGAFGMMPRPEMWMGSADPHFPGIFPGGVPPPGGALMGPRGAGGRVLGMMGMPRPMGVGPLNRPPLPPLPATSMGGSATPVKPRTEDDDLKDLEALLNKKSFRELQKSKTGEELLDLIHRPTARETAVAAKFKTKGGPQLKEYCTALTKEDCRRQNGSFIACEKVHFRRIIAPHTDINLGDCSFLDTCRHMKTCKYVHYELDPTPDVPAMMIGAANIPPQKPIKPQRAEYCSEVELGEPQWINCDIRSFRMDILGKFGVIMADPPWDIHMELPYGTMADDEMRNLNVPALQTDGLIFLWVTGRAMELGRECLELWGYKRVEELIWVKTNQLQRIIRTGRTGHWLNHSKEHCLVGIKGNPEVNRNIDTDVIVAEVRETSRKPDEMYPMLERISPRTRKLELFARMHNTHAGWISLGNQLNGVRVVDEGLRARFKAAYPDIEVQPASPPRASTADMDLNSGQLRIPFSGADSKSTNHQFMEMAGLDHFGSDDKPMLPQIELVG